MVLDPGFSHLLEDPHAPYVTCAFLTMQSQAVLVFFVRGHLNKSLEIVMVNHMAYFFHLPCFLMASRTVHKALEIPGWNSVFLVIGVNTVKLKFLICMVSQKQQKCTRL